MPRPKKSRKVCCLPRSNMFGPVPGRMARGEIVVLSVDEYETMRLIDYEGLSQEECAQSMDVARTTVQRMYVDARQKISDCIVNGKLMKIEGGDYKLCGEYDEMCGYGRCQRHRNMQINQTKGNDENENSTAD